MNIQEIRKQYPQYSDLSDEQLAKGLHDKFYADMPFDTFAGRIGFSTSAKPTGEEISQVPQVSPEALVGAPTEGDTSAVKDLAQAIGERAIGGAKYITGAEPEKRGSLLGDVAAAVERANVGVANIMRAPLELGERAIEAVTPEGTTTPLKTAADYLAKIGSEGEARAKSYEPTEHQDILSRGVSSGVQSLAQNLMTLPLAVLNAPKAALGVMGAITGGQSYQEAREKGLTPEQALAYGIEQGSAEIATELMPFTKLVADINKRTGFGRMLMNQIASDMPGEQLATLIQDFNEWATLHPDKSLRSFLDNYANINKRGAAALETAIATIVGVGGNVVAGKGIQLAAEKLAPKKEPIVPPKPPAQEVPAAIPPTAAAPEAVLPETILAEEAPIGPAPAPAVEPEVIPEAIKEPEVVEPAKAPEVVEPVTPKAEEAAVTKEEVAPIKYEMPQTLEEAKSIVNTFLESIGEPKITTNKTDLEEVAQKFTDYQKSIGIPEGKKPTGLRTYQVPNTQEEFLDLTNKISKLLGQEALVKPEDIKEVTDKFEQTLAKRKAEPEKVMPRPAEIVSLEKEADRTAKQIESLDKLTRENSLYEFFTYRPTKKKEGAAPAYVPDNRLDVKEVSDISPDKTFNLIRKKGGASVSDFVKSQQLNDWLPYDLRIYGTESAEELSAKEPAAEEYIKESLRNKNYLPYETKLELDRLGYSLEQIERELAQELSDEELRNEANALAAEIAAEEGLSTAEAPLEAFPAGRVAERVAEPTEVKPAKPTKEERAAVNRQRQEEKRKTAEEAKAVEKREEKAIADREVDLFKLQPTIQDLESAPTADLFGAKDLLVQPPKRPPILDKAAKETGLFAATDTSDKRYAIELPVLKPGDLIESYEVLEDVPNRGSISASLEDYEILDGIRQVPFAAFEVQEPQYASKTEENDTKELADQIKTSGKIKPLIVVQDEKGFYVLEGSHRFDALLELKSRSLPALVVIDKDRTSAKDESRHLETTVKDTLKKLENDFMIGDEVRIGNSPGVVVGIEGDYVRVHPDRSDNPKAYRRVQKKLVTFISRPDLKSSIALSTQSDQDKKFGEEQGRLNADMGGLIQLLGANMYASNVADVAVKELLQNAFDAVKGAVSDFKEPSLYKSGQIEIDIDRNNRTISIKDNARGMSPEIVRQAFFTVAGSDKSDLPPHLRSGGLGLAKMGFMLGSEQLKLDTVRDGVRVTVDTTAKDIANSNFIINKSPAKKSEHGTTVTVKIPSSYVDPKTGDKKPIWFPYSVENIEPLNKPLIGPVKVNLKFKTGETVDEKTLPVGLKFPKDKYQKLKVNFDWGSADVYFGIDRVDRPSHQVLSSGVYQFNHRFMLSDEEIIPYNIIVDVKSDVEAKHPDYPFENSRERFKGRLDNDVKALTAYVGKIARGNEMADLQDTFKNIVSMPRTEVGKETAETSKKLRKAFERKGVEKFELPPLPQEVTVTGDTVVDTKGTILVDISKEAEKKLEASFEAEKAAPGREKYMLEMPQDPKNPIFHNNTSADLIKVGEKYGDPMAFFSEMGTLMIEMKEALAKSNLWGYKVLAPENLFFGGIAIDKKYGGVHIKVPYKAVLINPFYDWGAKTLFGVRANIFSTMVHEIAHTGDMDHGVGHNTNMTKVEQYLEDEGLADYFRDALLDILVRHESTFTAMREEYGKSTTANVGKSLEDYEKSKSAAASRRVEPSGEGEDWIVSAGGGQERGEVVQARGRRDKERGVGGGTGEEVRKLLDETGRTNTPMLDHEPVKNFVLKSAQTGKEIVNEVLESPYAVISDMAGALDREVLRLRNRNVWFGSGLNAADFSRYNGQLRTSQELATASVALDNAIRGGTTYVQVIKEGSIEWNDKFQNFVAVTKPYSMVNVYKEEAKLKKRIGDQTGQDLIQGYLEAKRSRSIQNEYYKRQEDVTNLEIAIENTTNPETLRQFQNDLIDAKDDLDRVQVAFDKIAMTDEVIDEFIAQDKKFPELAAIMDNWTKVNQDLLLFWRQTGILSEKRYEQLSSIKDYVPWQRIMTIEEDPHSPVQSTTRTMTNVGKEKVFKKGTPKVTTTYIAKEGQKAFRIQPSSVVAATVNGKRVPAEKFSVTSDGMVQINIPIKAGDTVMFEGIREIENIIDNMTRNVGMMVMNGLRNYAGNRIASEYGTKNEEGQLKTFKRADREAGIFNVLIDGRRVNVQVADPLVAEAALGMETMNIEAVKIFGALANITRRTITLSGAFQIKQVFKDAPTAMLVTGVKRPDILLGGVFKGFYSALTKSDPVYDILRKAGVGGFHSPARTPEAEVKRQIGIVNRSVYDWTIALLDHFGDSSDMAQRIATYKRVLKETGDEAQALYQAANVINFLHHGSGQLAQIAVRTIPFMGAYANSIDVLVQAVAGGGLKGMSRKKALARIAMTGSLLVGVTLLYCMLLGADDDYWELDDQTRLKNFIVPFARASDGSMIMMPMNTSAAFFFKAIPELIYNKVVKEGTESELDATRLRKALANAAKDTLMGPTPLPAGLKPVIEIAINHDFFTGRTVIPRGLENEEAWQQYTASTSELGKFLSAASGGFASDKNRILNPIEADHLVKGLFGTAGAMAQWSSNIIADAITGEKMRPEPTVRETPLVGGFVTPPVPRGREDLFYGLKEATDQAYETYMSLVGRENYVEADKYLKNNEKLINYHSYTNTISETLKDINSEIRRISELSDMSPKDKRTEITNLQKMKNDILDEIQAVRKEAGL